MATPYLVAQCIGATGQKITSQIPEVGLPLVIHPSTNLGSLAPTWASDRATWTPGRMVPTTGTRWGYWPTTLGGINYRASIWLWKVTAFTYQAGLLSITNGATQQGYDWLLDGRTNTFNIRKHNGASITSLGSLVVPVDSTGGEMAVEKWHAGSTATFDVYWKGVYIGSLSDGSSTGAYATANYGGLGYAPNGGIEGSAANGYHWAYVTYSPLLSAAASTMMPTSTQLRLGEGAQAITLKRRSGTAFTGATFSVTDTAGVAISGLSISAQSVSDADTASITIDPGTDVAKLGTVKITSTTGQTTLLTIVRTIPQIIPTSNATLKSYLSNGVYGAADAYWQTGVPGNGLLCGIENARGAQVIVDLTPTVASFRPTIGVFAGAALNRYQFLSTDDTTTYYNLFTGATDTAQTPIWALLEAVDRVNGGDLWTGAQALRFTGLVLPGNAALYTPTSGLAAGRSGRILGVTDSKGIGFAGLAAGDVQTSHSGSIGFAHHYARALNKYLDIVGVAGGRFTASAGTGTWPAFSTAGAWGKYDSTHAIDWTLYEEVLIDMGYNDWFGSSPASPYTVALANFNAAHAVNPDLIWTVMSSGGRYEAELHQAAQDSNIPNDQLYLVSTASLLQWAIGMGSGQPANIWSLDAIHLIVPGMMALLGLVMETRTAPAVSTGTTTAPRASFGGGFN